MAKQKKAVKAKAKAEQMSASRHASVQERAKSMSLQEMLESRAYSRHGEKRFLCGLEIREPRETLFFAVSSADIKQGKRRDPYHCPGACGLRRVPGIIDAAVFKSIAYLVRQSASGKSTLDRYKIGNAAKVENYGFDSGGTHTATDYHLLPVPGSLSLWSPRGRSDATGPKKGTVATAKVVRGVGHHRASGSRPDAPRTRAARA